MTLQIAITVLISILILVVEHYWPWKLILGHKLGRLESYVSGVLAMLLPFSGLLIVWQYWQVLISVWLIAGASGLTVFGLYALDRFLVERTKATAAEQAEKVLKDGTLTQ